jgi:hypothetical protein
MWHRRKGVLVDRVSILGGLTLESFAPVSPTSRPAKEQAWCIGQLGSTCGQLIRCARNR